MYDQEANKHDVKQWFINIMSTPEYSRTLIIQISIIQTLSYLNAILNFKILDFLQNQVINEMPVWF